MKRRLIIYLFLAVLPAFGADKPSVARVLFAATVQQTTISIHLAERPFDPTRHKTTELIVDDKGHSTPATVDGRIPIGTDQTLPCAGTRQLSQLYVLFGKRRVDVPERLLTHVFIPHNRAATFDHQYAGHLVSVSADAKAVLISLGVGDGGGAGTYTLYVGADGTCTDKEPSRPEP